MNEDDLLEELDNNLQKLKYKLPQGINTDQDQLRSNVLKMQEALEDHDLSSLQDYWQNSPVRRSNRDDINPEARKLKGLMDELDV